MDREERITNDRIAEYLVPFMDEYVFDELSDNYLERAGVMDILKGIPVPINKSELGDLSNVRIAHSMAMVIGCDVDFPHKDNYIQYIKRTFTDEFVKPLINEGIEFAVKDEYLRACVCFRAAILIWPENVDALYCYGRACRDAYETGEGEEYVGRFKAESLEAFEKLTLLAPDFEMGYYYLGFGYLNLGLYIKAKLTFEEFLKLTEKPLEETAGIPQEVIDERNGAIDEVRTWVSKLEEPVKIELGYNHVLAGRYKEGLETLTPYTESESYKDWWPLYYYLAIAHKEEGEPEKAEENLLKALKLSPGDIQIMGLLVDIYEELGNEEKAEKYRSKIKVVERNIEEEKAEKDSSYS